MITIRSVGSLAPSFVLPHSSFCFPIYFAPHFAMSAQPVATDRALPPLPPAAAIIGDSAALQRDVIPFSVVVALDGNWRASFDLFEQKGLTSVVAGRASAVIHFPLTISLLLVPSPTAAAFLASGAVCIRQSLENAVYPTQPHQVAACPGQATIFASMMGCSPVPLGRPPLICDDVLISQSIGSPPRICAAFSQVGLQSAHLVVSGTVSVHGVGEVSPF